VNITDTSTVGMLRDLLRSGHEREVVYALDLLAGVEDASLVDDLRRLLDHRSVRVKRRALARLKDLGARLDAAELEPLVRDADAEVRLAAILLAVEAEGVSERLRAYIEDGSLRVAASALRAAAYDERNRSLFTRERVEGLVGARGEHALEVRVEVTRALGEAADPAYRDVLRSLARDEETAGEAVLAMGATRDRDFVPDLLDMVAVPGLRKFARAALARYGNRVVGTLGDYLADDRVDMGIRRNLPVVLSRIPTQQSADALAGSLDNVDASLRFRVVKALNKLRKKYPELRVDERRVDAAFVEETKTYYEIMHVSSLRRGGAGPAEKLLSRALEERLDHNLERIFRLLGLHYPPNDIYNAYLGIVGSRKDQRASAVEFLDNVLGANLKRYLFPIIDQVSESVTIQRGRDLFGLDIKDRDGALLTLLGGRDAWLRACAAYCAAGCDSQAVKDALARAQSDPDPIVAEAAALAMGGAHTKGP
jgi:hypothetical protein